MNGSPLFTGDAEIEADIQAVEKDILDMLKDMSIGQVG